MHFYGAPPQLYHTLALFDPPKMGNSMTTDLFEGKIWKNKNPKFRCVLVQHLLKICEDIMDFRAESNNMKQLSGKYMLPR